MRSNLLLLAMLGTAALAAPAGAIPLLPIEQDTSANASAKITSSSGVDANVNNSDAHDTSAIADVLGLHVQSAGRSRLEIPQTIAANASFVASRFTERTAEAIGQATQTLKFAVPPGSLHMHFVLPSLLLEISDNVERLGAGGVPIGGDLFTQLQATIDLKVSGGTTIHLFSLLARLDGNFNAQNLIVQRASIDPGLDLSAFDNQVPIYSGDLFFIRTATWEFPTFEGDLDLSAYTGNILEIEYVMGAFANGRADITTAAASINDPFVLQTDPTGTSLLTFDFVGAAVADPNAVPAPGGLGMLAVVLCGFAALRRRSA